MSKFQYQRLLQMSAATGLSIAILFFTPWTFVVILRSLNSINDFVSWPRLPDFDPLQTLFVNMFASTLGVWCGLRLIRPSPLLGLFDGGLRFIFALCQIYYVLVYKLTPLICIFALNELAWGIPQVWGYFFQGEKNE